MPPADKTRAAPAIRPAQADHGAMWIMLQHMTASACATGQCSAVTSSRRGGSRLAKPAAARCAAMLASASRIGIGRLPSQRWQLPRKISRMLAAAAGDFEHEPLRRQNAPQYLKNRLAIAHDMGAIEARVGCVRTWAWLLATKMPAISARHDEPAKPWHSKTKKPRGFPRGF